MKSKYWNYFLKSLPTYIIAALISYVLIISIQKSDDFLSNPTNILLLISLAIILISNTLKYLEVDNGKSKSEEFENDLNEIKSLLRNKRFQHETDINQKILQELLNLKTDVTDSKVKSIDLTENDKTSLFNLLEKNLEKNLSSEFLSNIEQTYGDAILNNERIKNLYEETLQIKKRLNFEIRKLSRRANVNLAIGSITTLVAVAVLYITVASETIDFKDYISLASHFIPRISVVVFIEIFAFFFLKLYKSNLENIRYFHNELTNIEMKLVSLKTSMISSDKESLSQVINEMTKTERNFILKKNESTIELEKMKNDKENTAKLLSTIKDLTHIFNKKK